MAVITVHQASVAPVEILRQLTAPAGSSLSAGNVVRYSTGGCFVPADSGAASTASAVGINLTTTTSGFPATAVADGTIDIGAGLSDKAYGDGIFMGDESGGLSAASGTVQLIAGRVRPAFGFPGTQDKILEVNFGAFDSQLGADGSK